MSFIEDIKNFVGEVWDDVMEFFTELPLKILDGFLDAVAWVIETIPLPEFLTEPVSTYIPDEIVWLLIQSGFHNCLTVILSGVVFYFFRRILTLGIW